MADPATPAALTTEGLVLKAAILGVRADRSTFKRMWHGRNAHRAVAEARERSPDHPRALVQHGILMLHTPASFGGGPDAAQPILERARAALDREANRDASGGGLSWGWLDASVWLGQALAAGGDHARARVVYTETLAREPEMGWIRNELLPALDGDDD